ncbi:MAG TPA: helical backbone metal receptor [Candidatus Acidoferrales bacterium]|nr:helical backbone metal receptor [Candidatus Acidoferrales bacterium]
MALERSIRRFLTSALIIACAGITCTIQPTASSAALFRLRQQNAPPAANPAIPPATTKSTARMITDETGRHMAIPLNVERVVTLAPNLTETVYALGLQDKLAADTTYCEIPPAAKEKPHVGGPQNPSLEAIVAMHPDLVLASTSINRPQTADALLKLGIPVYTSAPHTVTGMLNSTAEIADLLGAKDPGAKLVADLQKRLDALHALLQDRPMAHVLFAVWEDPLISIGQNTFIADALRWAGAESVITSDQNWPQVSMEEVVRLQPDYIVLTADHLKAENATQGADLSTRPTWRDLQAVKLGRVVVASDEMDRPSPGLIGAIEQLAHDFHPEVFGAKPPENGKVKIENGRYFATVPESMKERNACAR